MKVVNIEYDWWWWWRWWPLKVPVWPSHLMCCPRWFLHQTFTTDGIAPAGNPLPASISRLLWHATAVLVYSFQNRRGLSSRARQSLDSERLVLQWPCQHGRDSRQSGWCVTNCLTDWGGDDWTTSVDQYRLYRIELCLGEIECHRVSSTCRVGSCLHKRWWHPMLNHSLVNACWTLSHTVAHSRDEQNSRTKRWWSTHWVRSVKYEVSQQITVGWMPKKWPKRFMRLLAVERSHYFINCLYTALSNNFCRIAAY